VSSKSSKSRKCLQTKQRKKVTLTSQGPAVAAVALDFVVEVQSNITKRKKEKRDPTKPGTSSLSLSLSAAAALAVSATVVVVVVDIG